MASDEPTKPSSSSSGSGETSSLKSSSASPASSSPQGAATSPDPSNNKAGEEKETKAPSIYDSILKQTQADQEKKSESKKGSSGNPHVKAIEDGISQFENITRQMISLRNKGVNYIRSGELTSLLKRYMEKEKQIEKEAKREHPVSEEKQASSESNKNPGGEVELSTFTSKKVNSPDAMEQPPVNLEKLPDNTATNAVRKNKEGNKIVKSDNVNPSDGPIPPTTLGSS